MFKNENIPELNFKYIAVVPLEVWDRKLHTSNYMETLFMDILAQFQAKEIKSICLTEIDCEMGYPANSTSKAFVKSFHTKQHIF